MRIPSPVSRLLLGCALVSALSLTALAGPASDAYKQAKAKATVVDRMTEGPERETAQKQLAEFCKSQAESLLGGKLGKMDLMYVGMIYGMGDLHEEAVKTLRRAVADPGKTKYGAHIHAALVQALIDSGDLKGAFIEFQEMAKTYPDTKQTKKMAMNTGIALRTKSLWKESAAALGVALEQRKPDALKPLVNSCLMAGDQAGAIKWCERAIELAGEAGAKDSHTVLLETTKKIGTKLTPQWDAFNSEDVPNTDGKVVVIGFWNVSFRSLRWTMQLLENIRVGYPDDVVTIAASTYYKKDPETGKIVDSMSAEAERELGKDYHYEYKGPVGYAKDASALADMGLSGLPHITVLGRDGTLIFSHTLNRASNTDVDILSDVLEKAVGAK